MCGIRDVHYVFFSGMIDQGIIADALILPCTVDGCHTAMGQRASNCMQVININDRVCDSCVRMQQKKTSPLKVCAASITLVGGRASEARGIGVEAQHTTVRMSSRKSGMLTAGCPATVAGAYLTCGW